MSKDHLINIRRHLIGALKHIETLLNNKCEHEFVNPYEKRDDYRACIKCNYMEKLDKK